MSDASTQSEVPGDGPLSLVLIGEDGAQRSVLLEQGATITFGRSADCALRLDHPSVSRAHARFQVGKHVTVEDLGSRNTTRVRGEPIAPGAIITLREGDVVQCGAAMIVLRRTATGPAGTPAALALGPDGIWFELQDARISLGRRGALRRMLVALADKRVESPGRAMSVAEMFEAGWPGDRARFESAQARVYTSVQRLRALGLAEILVTRDDGYLLDPAVTVSRAE